MGSACPAPWAAVARPSILARVGHHRGPHRVGLDVPQNDEQVVAALDDRASESGPARRGRWFPVSGGAARGERQSGTGGCG